MKSKLNPTKYPTADPAKYLKFINGADSGIDPVFAGRLAAWARDHKQILTCNNGYRSDAKQHTLFLAAGGKYDPKIGYYWPSSVPMAKRTVAKPGKSFHGFRLAIDTTSLWAKAIEKLASFAEQHELAKYGLCKPMTKGNGQTVLEDWHIQPIETINVPMDKRKDLMPLAA